MAHLLTSKLPNKINKEAIKQQHNNNKFIDATHTYIITKSDCTHMVQKGDLPQSQDAHIRQT